MDLNNIGDKESFTIAYDNEMYSSRPDFPIGAVLLDLDERDLPGIVSRVVDQMITSDQIPEEHRETLLRILLQKRNSSIVTAGTEEKPSSEGRRRSSVRRISNGFPLNNEELNGVVSNGTIPKDAHRDPAGYIRHNLFTEIDIDSNVLYNNKETKCFPEGGEMTAVMAGGVSFLQSPILIFVRLAEGVLLRDLIEASIPVRFIYVLLGPFHDEKDYQDIGLSISNLMASKAFRQAAYTVQSKSQLLFAANEVLPPSSYTRDIDLIDATQIMKKRESILIKNAQCEQAAAAAAAAAGDGNDGDKKPPERNPLIRVGIPFYGVYRDIKDRYVKYPSDIIDGFNAQVAAAAIFIFFAALSPAITFGGMYADKMDNYIGVGECLLLSCVNGVIFALFAAQPLLIVGATGPLMVFDMSLFQFCQTNEIDFLSIRVWIGIWMTVIGLLVVAVEAIALVRKFTRFIEEIFASLVCIIFIYEAITNVVAIFYDHPLLEVYSCGYYSSNTTSDPNTTMEVGFDNISDMSLFDSVNGSIIDNVNGSIIDNVNGSIIDNVNGSISVSINSTIKTAMKKRKINPQPNTSLLSLILMLGTFIIAIKLKYFRNSKYLGRGIRRSLGDFGVPIAIFLMVLLDYLIKDTYTDKLTMPEGIQPSNPAIRGWLINPMGQEKPLPVYCIFAAAPASILVFFLIFLEENICHLILSKPERKMVKGSGFHLDLVLSCFINFLSGLLGAPFMGPACVRTVSHAAALTVTSSARGPGESPKIEGIREQRLSAFVVSVLVGLAVLLSDALNLVPKAVLFGVFLYMGIASTAGIQLFERSILMLMPVKYYPDTPYVRKVRPLKIHLFTLVQILMLGILWAVKQSPASLALPFVLILLIPLRLCILPYIFSKTELSALDGTESNLPEDEDELDFYEAAHQLPTDADHDHQS